MLKGKTVLLGITGSIAAYKIAYLASALHKLHADVHVLMTENATNFINPITFETLTGNKCLVDTFDRNFQFQVEHVSIAKKADVVMIAPASANVIGKLANGLADDMLTTTVMACRCQKILSPAMNTAMYENPVVQDNIRKLKNYGYEVITPASGYLACGDTGAGKMPEPETLLEYILKEAAFQKDLAGKKLLVTAGPTQEAIDPVRYITNHSTGKMGYAIAKTAALRGAEVTLVSGPAEVEPPMFVNFVPVVTAKDMFEAVTGRSDEMDAVIKAAAVADYRPKFVNTEKTKKKDGDMDSRDILTIKGLIRRGEARTASSYNNIPLDRVHFLDLPFYETGKIQKNPISEADVEIVRNLLREIKPHQIFVAGDLADPHGTHRVCTDAVFAAVDLEKEEGAKWLKDCRIWMYRGAWAEWEIENIEMAVPISPEELRAKRNSILKHQSQMESAPFLGNDERLFWQRSEDRNRGTATLYDQLGLASYEAMEAFVEYIPL